MLTLVVIIILHGRFMHEASNERMKNENNKIQNKLSSRLVTVYFNWPSLGLNITISYMIVILKILFRSCDSKSKVFCLEYRLILFCFIVLKNYYTIESTVARFLFLRGISKTTIKNHIFLF